MDDIINMSQVKYLVEGYVVMSLMKLKLVMMDKLDYKLEVKLVPCISEVFIKISKLDSILWFMIVYIDVLTDVLVMDFVGVVMVN